MTDAPRPPDASRVEDAARALAPLLSPTPILRDRRLDEWLGARVHVKAECFQPTGAFKARGATFAVLSLSDEVAARGVATHSSGNHGGALAWAAAARGIPCTVVVPEGAPETKVQAMARSGATLVRCAPTAAAREAGLAKVVAETGATPIHPYEHPDVIAGQGTMAREVFQTLPQLDALVVPIGGGGLFGGSALARASLGHPAALYAAEPEGAADAARSFAAGERDVDFTPETIADGLRTPIGRPNFTLLRAHAKAVLPVSEAEIAEAMVALRDLLGVVVEPSGAVALAGAKRAALAGQVAVVISGRNVDPDRYAALVG